MGRNPQDPGEPPRRGGGQTPKLANEYCWDSGIFLAETRIKAGLMPDCWLDRLVKVKKFQGGHFQGSGT